MVNHLGIGFALLLFGIFSVLKYFNIIQSSDLEITSITIIVFTLVTIISSMNKIKRSSLFLISVLLNVGIILLVLENFEILSCYNVLLASLLFIFGSGFFILFVQNPSEKFLLMISLFFLILSFTILVFFESNSLIKYANRITIILFDYWPVFLVIFGIVLVAGKRRHN